VRARPLVATLAVIASPPASDASTEAFVAPGAVRLLLWVVDAPFRRVLAARVGEAVSCVLAAAVWLRATTRRVCGDVDDDAGCDRWPSRFDLTL
jgi:hypothetical protein